MSFTDEEIVQLKEYCQAVIEHPRRLEDQIHKIEAGHIWCRDWEIVEILKYLFNGEVLYYEDPPPNRARNNPLWPSKEVIVATAQQLLEATEGEVYKIIQQLEQRRNGQDL